MFMQIIYFLLVLIALAIVAGVFVLIFYFCNKKFKNVITNPIVRTIVSIAIADIFAILLYRFLIFLIYGAPNGYDISYYFKVKFYYYLPIINRLVSLFNGIKNAITLLFGAFSDLFRLNIQYFFYQLIYSISNLIEGILIPLLMAWIFVKFGLEKDLSFIKGGFKKNSNSNTKANNSNVNYNTAKNVNRPNVNNSNVDVASQIKQYKELLDVGAITQEEYDKKKKELLKL